VKGINQSRRERRHRKEIEKTQNTGDTAQQGVTVPCDWNRTIERLREHD